MSDHDLLGPWIRRFLLEYLVADRNLSRNTQVSYRDTLTLLLPFASHRAHVPIDRMRVQDLSVTIVRAFLEHVEHERDCSVATRNLRLGTVRSLAHFIGTRSPEHLAWCSELRTIAFKKTPKAVVGYLERAELDALLGEPNRRTALGARDYALLLFLYNSGARADEAARLTAANLQLGTSASVRILGKGNKWRVCPLWEHTAIALRPFATDRAASEVVFRGRTGAPITRFGIHRLVSTYAHAASKNVASLASKRVSPHVIRHTTAVHLLRAGVDINTIRAWLGHVSLDTTHVYAEVDLDMKAKALAKVDLKNIPSASVPRKALPSLMTFLRGL